MTIKGEQKEVSQSDPEKVVSQSASQKVVSQSHFQKVVSVNVFEKVVSQNVFQKHVSQNVFQKVVSAKHFQKEVSAQHFRQIARSEALYSSILPETFGNLRNSAQKERIAQDGCYLLVMSTILNNMEAILTIIATTPSWIAANTIRQGA